MTPPVNEIQQLKKLILAAESNLREAREVLAVLTGEQEPAPDPADEARESGRIMSTTEGKIIEGVFDGQNMVGPDGKTYSVPANYASKSKLIEGDRLKLTITGDGSFIYKQIGPVERQRLIGILAKDDLTNEYRVMAGDRTYRVLLASVTYFKGEAGDEVVILVPKGIPSHWAAVENIIKASNQTAVPVVAAAAADDLDRP
ncbi:MAG: hypothetical protein HY567_02910 [Candidatus Kerfeldbacteria bacterium]|nr:hypothetical protein [Candidatus Kerfeldbacteria bacterium]